MLQLFRAKKTGNHGFFLSLIIIVLLVSLFGSSAFAEKGWTFENGHFKSDQYLLEIPSAISTVKNEGDMTVLFGSEKGDIALAINIGSAEGVTLDNLIKKQNVTDADFVASCWRVDDPDILTSSLKQIARIARGDIELLEYRFDAKLSGKNAIAYYTIALAKNSNQYCLILLLADGKTTYTAIMYYMMLIDSLTINPTANLAENEWLCGNCGTISSGNYCSMCGAKRPGLSTDSDIGTTVIQQENNNVENSVLLQESSRSYDSVVSLAKSLSGLIAYNSDAPINGDTVSVSIEGKTILVHADFKYAMDIFYDFYKEYINSITKLDIKKMTALALKVEEIDSVLDKIDNMDLSDGDMAYYINIYAKILEILGDINSQ